MAGRGGLQQPQRPAAVSTPGSGRRTDGGAGSKSQPLRVPSGGAYGERKAATEQQQSAPLATGSSAPAGGAGGSPTPGAPSAGAFGATQRPMESNTAGLSGPTGNPLATNPQAVLRVMYAQFPHPAIARLIDWSAGNPQ